MVVHSGDFTMTGSEAEEIDFLNWFCDLPYRQKIFICGNHDACLYGASIDGSYLPLAVTCTAVHFEGVQFTALNHVPDGGLAHAELFGRLFLGEWLVFLRLHEDGEKTLASGFNCVHHQLMEVGEMDGEKNIGRIRVGQRHLKEVV